MDPAVKLEQVALSRQKGLSELIDRGDSPVQLFYNNATILITGGSGFLGKQLLEKLCRSTTLNKVYLLMRPKKGKQLEERLSTVLTDPIFDMLHKTQPKFTNKLIPIEGDVAKLELGISDQDRDKLIDEVDIIFHVAATIAFNEPIKMATFTNVRGTREVISLAKRCKNLKSLLYVSTAYSNATISRCGKEITEQFYPSPIPPDIMIELAENLDQEMLNNIKSGLIGNWPNTYTFTKALAEDMIRKNCDDLHVNILRPTIVIGARREPNPGWLDISSVFGPSGFVLGCMMGIIHIIISRHEIKIDLVPSDYVANAALIVATAKQKLQIFTVSSSYRNPITWGLLSNILNNKAPTVISPKIVSYCFAIETRHVWLYNTLKLILHQVPAYLVDGVCLIINTRPRLRKIYSTIDKMTTVLKYFTTNDWVFIDNNTEKLFKNLTDTDKMIYHCDTSDIDWTEQVLLWCIGLRKYIVKDGLKDTEWGLRKQFYFKILAYIISATVLYVIFSYLLLWFV